MDERLARSHNLGPILQLPEQSLVVPLVSGPSCSSPMDVDFTGASLADLLTACLQSNETAAWEEFVRRFHRVIAGVVLRGVRRWGEASTQLVDELVQETYLKLCADDCRLLRDFRPRHPDALYGYLKVIAANVVQDHFRSARSAKRGGFQHGDSSYEATVPSGSDGTPAAVERRVLLAEIDRFLRAQENIGARERLIFWLYYRQGLTAKAISAVPAVGLSVKGVESSIFRLTRMVRVHLVRHIEAQHQPGVDAPEGLPEQETF